MHLKYFYLEHIHLYYEYKCISAEHTKVLRILYLKSERLIGSFFIFCNSNQMRLILEREYLKYKILLSHLQLIFSFEK